MQITCPPLPRTPPPPLTAIEAALCAQLQISENVNCKASTSNLLPACNELDNSTVPISSDLNLNEIDSSSSRRSSPSLLKYGESLLNLFYIFFLLNNANFFNFRTQISKS